MRFGKIPFLRRVAGPSCQAERGTLAVRIREAQRTLTQSSKWPIESMIAGLGLGHQFKVCSDKIATPGDGAIILGGLQAYPRRLPPILPPTEIAHSTRRLKRRYGCGWLK